MNHELIIGSFVDMKRSGMDRGSSSNRIDRTTRSAFIRRLLYDLVDDPSTDSIVSWSESGKSFIVWNEDEFGREFLPSRGLVERLSGFRKVDESEQSEFTCDAFVRGEPPEITRPGVTIPPAIHGAMASSLEYNKKKRSEMDGSSSSSHRDARTCLPREVYEFAYSQGDLGERSETDRDGSSRPCPSFLSPEAPTLRRKLYEMVDDSSTDSVVSWSESGKSFIVWNEDEFCRRVLPRCLPFTDMGYFTRWLESVGFTFTKADARLEFAEDYFLRGQPELTRPLTCEGFRILPETRRVYEKMIAYWKARNQEAEKI